MARIKLAGWQNEPYQEYGLAQIEPKLWRGYVRTATIDWHSVGNFIDAPNREMATEIFRSQYHFDRISKANL